MARVRAFVSDTELRNKEAVLDAVRNHIEARGYTGAELRQNLPACRDDFLKRLKSGRDDANISYSRAVSIAEALGLIVVPTFRIDERLAPRRKPLPRVGATHKRGLFATPGAASLTA